MATIQLRRGTAAAWTSANPTLSSGEIGVETDTLKFKVGNGSTAWNSLSYEGVPLDTDTALAANSDSRAASQKAVKAYADARIDDTAYDATSWNGDTTHAPSKNAVRDKFESLTSGATTNQRKALINFGEKLDAGLSTGVFPFATIAPCAATIIGWWTRVDTDCTIKFRKKASAAEPGTGDRINTSGLSVSSGITKSTTLTDFTTTAIAADDIIIPEITSITGTLTSIECGLIVTKDA